MIALRRDDFRPAGFAPRLPLNGLLVLREGRELQFDAGPLPTFLDATLDGWPATFAYVGVGAMGPASVYGYVELPASLPRPRCSPLAWRLHVDAGSSMPFPLNVTDLQLFTVLRATAAEALAQRQMVENYRGRLTVEDWLAHQRLGRHLHVFLGGTDLSMLGIRLLCADAGDGTVVILREDADGRPYFDPETGRVAMEVLRGDVEVRTVAVPCGSPLCR